jgi:hypothetical protein
MKVYFLFYGLKETMRRGKISVTKYNEIYNNMDMVSLKHIMKQDKL